MTTRAARLPLLISLRRLDELPRPGVLPKYEGMAVDQMVAQAQSLSLQAETLDAAVELLDHACRLNAEVREKYSEMLLLWKRGIVL